MAMKAIVVRARNDPIQDLHDRDRKLAVRVAVVVAVAAEVIPGPVPVRANVVRRHVRVHAASRAVRIRDRAAAAPAVIRPDRVRDHGIRVPVAAVALDLARREVDLVHRVVRDPADLAVAVIPNKTIWFNFFSILHSRMQFLLPILSLCSRTFSWSEQKPTIVTHWILFY